MIAPCSIIIATANYFQVTVEDLLGRSRRQKYVVPRHVAMYLIRNHSRLSLAKIGMLFKRDHSCVLHAMENIGWRRGYDNEFHLQMLKFEGSLK